MSHEEDFELTARYRGLEAKFNGKPDDVIRSFFGFMSKILPAYDLVSSLTLTIDLEKLLNKLKGLIAFTPEGPVIKIGKEKLGGERNLIILNLVKAYVGFMSGKMKKDSLPTVEISGGKTGTVAARLSELTDLGWVTRIGRGEYRITTLGVYSFLDEILPKISLEEEMKVE